MTEGSVSPDYLEAKKILSRLLSNTGARIEMLYDNRRDLQTTWNKSKEASETLKDMKNREALNNLPPKARSISKLFAYLGLVESLGVTLIDMALVLLIANGEEMHIRQGGGIRHVSTLKELRKLDLVYKLEFLKANMLQFVGGVINRELRNNIAHLKFQIEENGDIVDSNRQSVNIDDELQKFWERVGHLISLFEEIRFLKWVESVGHVRAPDASILTPMSKSENEGLR